MLFGLFLVIALSVSLFFCTDVFGGHFYAVESICDIPQRISAGCSQEVPHNRSLLHCVALCFREESCIKATVSNYGTCFLHSKCHNVALDCNVEDNSIKNVERRCVHGSWNTLTQTCDCPAGVNGTQCQIVPPFCSAHPRGTGEMYRIFIDPEQQDKNLIPVTCRNGGKNMIIFRNQGRLSFNKTWEEYKRGFYIDDFHHWIGLDNWHRLSNAGCTTIQLDLNINNGGTGTPSSFRRYRNAFLSNEDDDYQFVGSNSGYGAPGMPNPNKYFIPNCLHDMRSKPFSTPDRDSDGNPGENCAARAGSGSWYLPGCDNLCNLLGLGMQHWNSTPSHQHLDLNDENLGSIINQDSYMELYTMEC